jgi:hypothetical protein
MRRLVATAVACLAIPSLAGASAYPINPGYWEVTTDWLGLVKKTERYCVEPKAIPRFLAGPCNHIYHCTYPVQQFHDGKAHFEGEIRGHDELYHVTGGGDYSPTSMDMKITGAGHWHIVPIVGAEASMKAHFLAEACPADAKHIKPSR